MKTILVVDDEIGSAELLAMILNEEGYSARAAVSGEKALEQARKVPPDILIVDFMMPVMNGVTLIRHFKADPALAHAKIVLNSGMTEATINRDFSDYDVFLRKPFRIEPLLEAVEKILVDL